MPKFLKNQDCLKEGRSPMKKLTTLRLGYSALSNWEVLMIKEGLISSYDRDFDIDELTHTSRHMRVDNRKFLLFALVLFDKIDASHLSMFNMDKLIDLGIVDEHAHMVESHLINMDQTSLLFQNLDVSMYQSNDVLSMAKSTAEEIMIANKEKIVRAILKQERVHERNLIDADEISKNYTKWLRDCEFWASATNFHTAKESMGILKESIMYGLYDSIISGSIYYDGTISSTTRRALGKFDITAEDVCRIMNIDLSPELYHLPIPSTISEAIMLRNRPEILAFRNIFFEWCRAIKQGDIDMAVRIKRDVDLAKKELNKYYKWESSKIKLFSCITDIIIGKIPYLSDIVGAVSPFQTRNILRKKNKNSWILLLR